MQIVTIFIQNNQGEFLIQKRSNKKNGKYAITSGHTEENEKREQGIIREVKEELGIDIKKEDIKLFYNTEIDKKLYNLYYLKKDINISDLCLQKEEVEKVKWCTQEEVEQLIKNKEFYENQIEAWDLFKKYINEEEFYGKNSSMGHKQ
jgi:8-oxo-dGTP diphosphatase